MRIACWINKATDIHSEYDARIAFPHQQWIEERPPFLPYTYIACLLLFSRICGKFRRFVACTSLFINVLGVQ